MARMLSARQSSNAWRKSLPTGVPQVPAALRSVNVLREEETAKGSPRTPLQGVAAAAAAEQLGQPELVLSASRAARPRHGKHGGPLRSRDEPVAFFHPASLFMRWDAVTMLLLAFTATVTPFEVCFLEPIVDITNGLFWVDRVVDFLFAIDVFINFNLAYYDVQHARMVTGRRQVAWTYARGSALADIVSTIPFDVIGQSVGTHGASKLKVLRILRCVVKRRTLRIRAPDDLPGPYSILRLVQACCARSSRVLQRMQDSTNVNYGYLTLIKFAATCIFIAHWMAVPFPPRASSEPGDCNWVNHYYGSLQGHPDAACDPEFGESTPASPAVTSDQPVLERDDHFHGGLRRRGLRKPTPSARLRSWACC
jgi:hypothetical protein